MILLFQTIILTDGQSIYNRNVQPQRALDYRFPYPKPDEKHQDDSSILKEIVKKFILIPKRENATDDDYYDNPPSKAMKHKNENDDWQSKYDILKQLKNNEKQSEDSATLEEKSYSRESPLPQTNQILKSSSNAYIKQSFPLEHKHEKPQKDLTDKTDINYTEAQNDKHVLNQTEVEEYPVMENNNVNFGAGPNKIFDELQNPKIVLIDTIQIDTDQSFIAKDDHFTTEHVAKLPENLQTLSLENNNDKYNEADLNKNPEVVDDKHANENTEKIKILNSDDWDPIEVDETKLVAKIIPDAPLQATPIDTDAGQFPIDIIDVREFTPYHDVQLQDGININPEFKDKSLDIVPAVRDTQAGDIVPVVRDTQAGLVLTEANQAQETEKAPVQITGNEELEEEQKMFYDELVDENVDAVGSGDASVPEYAQNINEQYSYYEGVQPEPAHADVNEYEETSTRYDQNYEQQYANTYEEQGYVKQPEIEPDQNYEQYPQVYEQHSQEFENTEGYVQTPEGYEQNPEEYAQHPQDYEQQDKPDGFEQYPQGYVDNPEGYEQYPDGYVQPQGYAQPGEEGYDQQYQQQNYEAPEQIERQLDNELGYVEKQDVEEKPDVKEKQEIQQRPK